MFVPIIIGLATAGALYYAGQKDGAPDSDGDKKEPSLDDVKLAEYNRGKKEAKAEFDLEMKRRDEVEAAKKKAVDEYRLTVMSGGSGGS